MTASLIPLLYTIVHNRRYWCCIPRPVWSLLWLRRQRHIPASLMPPSFHCGSLSSFVVEKGCVLNFNAGKYSHSDFNGLRNATETDVISRTLFPIEIKTCDTSCPWRHRTSVNLKLDRNWVNTVYSLFYLVFPNIEQPQHFGLIWNRHRSGAKLDGCVVQNWFHFNLIAACSLSTPMETCWAHLPTVWSLLDTHWTFFGLVELEEFRWWGAFFFIFVF